MMRPFTKIFIQNRLVWSWIWLIVSATSSAALVASNYILSYSHLFTKNQIIRIIDWKIGKKYTASSGTDQLYDYKD